MMTMEFYLCGATGCECKTNQLWSIDANREQLLCLPHAVELEQDGHVVNAVPTPEQQRGDEEWRQRGISLR